VQGNSFNSLDITQAFSQHVDRRTVEKIYGKQPVDANKKATDSFAQVFYLAEKRKEKGAAV